MPWPVHPTGFFGARGDNDSYRIERSLRFNSADSAYLNRTPASAGNRKTWTWSGWVKRSNLGTAQVFYSASETGSSSQLFFDTSDRINIFAGAASINVVSTPRYRDVSSWYHIVVSLDTTQATASDRVKLYVNGTQVTAFEGSTYYPSQNAEPNINNSVLHALGAQAASGSITAGTYLSSYLTEINFIDGQALTPSSFGETDPITGRWKAKAYSGTYGTNGFYLKFADNSGTTSTTLGKDSSGNGNNWTPNNFSVTAGAGNDSLVDSPTNYGTDTGIGGEVRGNYATLNPSDNGGLTLGNGNLDLSASAAYQHARSGFGLSSGKWYFEAVFGSTTSPSIAASIGVATPSAILPSGFSGSTGIYFLNAIGTLWFNNQTSQTNISGTISAGTVLQCAIDVDGGKVWIGQNNTWYNSSGGTTGDPSTGSNPTFSPSGTLLPFAGGVSNTASLNFGQRPFAYTAPSGFKALCTTNLSIPTIQKPSKYMDVVAYTGTGASNSISSLGFSPDLVWIKNRGTTTDHALYDTTRGTQAQLSSNTTGSEVTSSTGLTAFGTNGFTIGTSSLVNTSGTQYVAWAWDEAPIAGMDIVGYTGNGTTQNISHSLGVAPKMIIVKSRSASSDWTVGHASLDATSPWGYYIFLSSTAARNSAGAINSWGNNSVVVPPTSSVFTIGSGGNLNASSATYIAYLFAEVEGFSKFGSYTGNGSADGPFVWCGFRPRWVMVKLATSTGESWYILDTQRDLSNATGRYLSANLSSAEDNYTATYPLDIVSNGFKLRNATYPNASSQTYIFAAFAESPFKYARAR